MASYFSMTEGAIWDILSTLPETGEGGTYRGPPIRRKRDAQGAPTGLDWLRLPSRQVPHRARQLVEIGVVTCRLSGPNGSIGFYSLPGGMTKDEFFTRKGRARFAWVESGTGIVPTLSDILVAKLDEMSMTEAYARLAEVITIKYGEAEVGHRWQSYRRQSARPEIAGKKIGTAFELLGGEYFVVTVLVRRGINTLTVSRDRMRHAGSASGFA